MSRIAKKDFSRILLNWWTQNKRDFPWRKTSDPYSILIAELLLRKTTAKQVEKLYQTFLNTYPTAEALSKADEEELQEMLRPLGMEYKRAKLFVNFAVAIVNRMGKIPASEEELMELPGVGRYSANSVLCLAFGKRVPMVDTNAVRVITRVFSFEGSKARPKDDLALWNFVKNLIPGKKARSFNLALIDFAYNVCTPRNPKCCVCPLKAFCDFGKTHVC